MAVSRKYKRKIAESLHAMAPEKIYKQSAARAADKLLHCNEALDVYLEDYFGCSQHPDPAYKETDIVMAFRETKDSAVREKMIETLTHHCGGIHFLGESAVFSKINWLEKEVEGLLENHSDLAGIYRILRSIRFHMHLSERLENQYATKDFEKIWRGQEEGVRELENAKALESASSQDDFFLEMFDSGGSQPTFFAKI